MKHMHVTIEINCVVLEVVGTYWPGEAESSDSPGESESVEIDHVYTASGDDIGGLVAWNDELNKDIHAYAMDAYKAINELRVAA